MKKKKSSSKVKKAAYDTSILKISTISMPPEVTQVRSLTPIAERTTELIESKKKMERVKQKLKSNVVEGRPPSRSCMINFDVFGYLRPITQ